MLSAVVVGTMLLSAMVLAAPPLSLSGIRLPQIFNSAYAATVTYDFVTETLPNGQPAYKLDGSPTATIPGPTLTVEEGDVVTINGVDTDFSVMNHPDEDGIVDSSYTFTVSTPGTFVYQDESSALIGLFGAVIVNAASGDAGSYVDGESGSVTAVDLNELDKEFVMFMVGSTFWVSEINGGSESPLWTNPTISAVQGDLVRFHILSVGPGHTFHLHAHRWVDPGTTNIIDTKLMDEEQVGEDSHVFIVAAGDQVGPGHWQYHCHVFAHMEAGMHGIFNVVETGPAISIPGASPYGGHPVLADGSIPGLVTFEISDEPGSWFRNTLDISAITKTRSLAVAKPGDSVHFIMSDTNTVHTITSLLWPTGAPHMPMDEVTSYKGGGIVMLEDPGLYVFTCKVHPYMFGGVIVDDLGTGPSEGAGSAIGESLDLGGSLTLVSDPTGSFPTASDLGLRLLKTFFVATTPANWKDYAQTTWNPEYPAVNIRAGATEIGTSFQSSRPGGGGLNGLLDFYFAEEENEDISSELSTPGTPGVGEVWVDTQFEKTESKSKPGTATAVNVADWTVRKKVSLPGINMNNPHNMWSDDNLDIIYQTEWFDNKLTTFERDTGDFVSQIPVGEAPSHVMTRTDTGDIHVALNGEDGVAEILETTSPADVNRIIPMQGLGQDPSHPHAHWMSADGQKMVTPNSFTGDTSLYGFDTGEIDAKPSTGVIPIATGMMPDSSKYYVANLLSSTLSVIDMSSGTKVKDINLLEDYNPVSLDLSGPGGFLSALNFDSDFTVGALPIQTPVSPDGKAVVTANTLSATITITNTTTDEVVTTLFCDAGCHGVQFGAKEGGGYYAYVSSKFSNAMIVVDPDPDGNGDIGDAAVVGKILLADPSPSVSDDEVVPGYSGFGGQGVLATPIVYNGWVQNTVDNYLSLSAEVQDWICDDDSDGLNIDQRDPNGSESPNVTDPC